MPQLIESLNNIIFSENFRSRHRQKPNDFIRTRLLPFHDLIFFLINMNNKSYQDELDRFFQAFGHDGALEAGATYEERIEKSSKKGQMGFADLVWKKHVLIEMKKRGEDLTKREHRTQTERYYIRLKKDDRPRYVMMCNFDEFHIYDFDVQPDEPVDIISLKQLPARSPKTPSCYCATNPPGRSILKPARPGSVKSRSSITVPIAPSVSSACSRIRRSVTSSSRRTTFST